MEAHPSNVASRDASNECQRRHISVYDRTSSDKGASAHSNATDDGAVGAECRSSLDDGIAVFILSGHSGTRVVDICKDHAWPAEHIVLQSDIVVYGDVVLDFDVVSDRDPVAHKDILTKRAVRADPRATADVRPMPHPRSISKLGPVVDNGGRVNSDIN